MAEVSLIDRQRIDDIFDVFESGVAPQSQPCREPKRIAEPVRIPAIERGLKTTLVEQQELERGGEVAVIAKIDGVDPHTTRLRREAQVVEHHFRAADVLQRSLRAGDIKSLGSVRGEILHARLAMGDPERIEPVQSLATEQWSRIKAGEILRGTPADHIDKRRMPILGPAGLVFLDTDGRRSEPSQDQREPHVTAGTHFENALSPEIAGGEVEPGQELSHLVPAIRIALAEIELVRPSRSITAPIGVGIAVVAGAEMKHAVPVAEIAVAVSLYQPDTGMRDANSFAVFKQE